MNLKKTKLGELISITRGKGLKGAFFAVEGDYKRITLGNFDLVYGGFKEDSSKSNIYYSEPVSDKFILKKGDIITPLTEQADGLIGSTAIIPESNKYILSQDIAKIDCDESKIDKDYCYYLLSTNLVRSQLIAGANKTSISHTSTAAINDCIVWIPELEEQKKIGTLLANIDQKISLNRQINDNLEAMARQLYEYWFVQFDFPDENGRPYKSSGGKMVWNDEIKQELPERWEVSALGNIMDINMGQSPKGASYNAIGEGLPFYQGCNEFGNIYPTIKKYTTDPVKTAKQHDILMSVRAPVGAINIANMDCCIGRGLCAVNNNYYTHLYFMIKDIACILSKKYNSGTTFGSICKADLEMIKVGYPHHKVLYNFHNICIPIFDILQTNTQEIDSLIEVRTSLLKILFS